MAAPATTPTHAAQLASARWGVSVALTGGRSAAAVAELLRALATQHGAARAADNGGR